MRIWCISGCVVSGGRFRLIVLYFVRSCKEEEERVDIKVLNIDNSDVVVLSQSSFFQLDKEGTELPMQCVLCTLENVSSTKNISYVLY